MIPQIMNFFWSGGPMSWLRSRSAISFKTLNPSWTVRLYRQNSKITEQPWKDAALQDFTTYSDEDYMTHLESYGVEVINWTDSETDHLDPIHQSDIFRWKLLSSDGGFYSDTDILFVRSFTTYNEMRSSDIVTCFYDGYFSIGFLGSSPRNSFYSDVLSSAREKNHGEVYESAGIPVIHNILRIGLRSHPDMEIIKTLHKRYPRLKVHHCDRSVVYPFTVQDVYGSVQDLPKQTIGIHWFAGYPHAQKFNKSAHPNTLNNKCLLSHYLREAII